MIKLNSTKILFLNMLKGDIKRYIYQRSEVHTNTAPSFNSDNLFSGQKIKKSEMIYEKSSHYTNIGIVKPKGLINVFELRDGGYVFLNEVKMWCRLPKDRENRKYDYEEQT